MRDEMFSSSLAATKDTYDQRAQRLFDHFDKDKAFCFSGNAFTAGKTTTRFKWTGGDDTNKDGLPFGKLASTLDPPRVAPGGTPVAERQVRQIDLSPSGFRSGIELYTSRSIKLF